MLGAAEDFARILAAVRFDRPRTALFSNVADRVRQERAARYALCATIDDMVLSTPWGSSSSWVQQSLTSVFHNEVIGGDRFFDILDQMQ